MNSGVCKVENQQRDSMAFSGGKTKKLLPDTEVEVIIP